MRPALPYLLLLVSGAATSATFTVDTTSDDAVLAACTAAPGDCSLRGAILSGNGAVGADSIEFGIPTSDPGCDAGSGICRIEVADDLPFISDLPLTIDGYTQPGALPNTIPAPGANNAQLKIEVARAGGFVSNKLFSMAGSSQFELRGLAIFLPSNGIVSGGLRHVIRGNWFGVTAAGDVPDYTGPGTVFDLGGFTRSIVIGGPDPADRNVIAGSGRDFSSPGLPGGGSSTIRVNSINSERARILFQGNLVGFGPDGIMPLPFRDPLIVNPGDDVFATPDVEILDNRMARAPRNFSCTCGGTLRFSVSRNMADPTLGRTALIQGNVFGVAVDGSVVESTGDHLEIFLGNNSRIANVRIGGLGLDEGNVFAGARPVSVFQLGSAVVLPSGSAVAAQVEVVGNRMLGNAGLGVDLRVEGIPVLGRTLNDAGDADSGANNRQNFPRISAYSVDGGSFDVTYRIDSAPEHSAYPLRVDFYRALGDEGEVLLDSDVYGAESAQQSKSVTLPIPPGVSLGNDDVIVAIATDAQGRSSEFSFDTLSLSATDSPDPHPAGLPFTVEVTAQATSGPFKPNGVVDVSMNTSPATTCSLNLAPTATAGTSRGSCELIPVVAGNRTLTISYRTQQGAFASASAEDVVITAPHEVTAPGPEQIGFGSCLAVAVEGRDAIIPLIRPSGGVASVSVTLSHETGSATEDIDYTPPPTQTISWAPGDIEPRVLRVPIAFDGQGEAVETFTLRLSEPQNTAILPNAAVQVRILDGEVQGFADSFELDCPS